MPPDHHDRFGRALKNARVHTGLSQAALARMTGVHHNTIYAAEAQRLDPQPRNIRRLADALGVIFCCSGRGWYWVACSPRAWTGEENTNA